ncbi:MAG: ribonuclease E/G [Pontixanthobacter sp.]
MADLTPVEWLVEEGIGEHRAIRVEDYSIAESRVHWPGEITAGDVYRVRIVHRRSGSPRATARLDDGRVILLDRLPVALTEGTSVRAEIIRGAIAERGRTKLPLGRKCDDEPRVTTLAQSLRGEGRTVTTVRRFPNVGWSDCVADALDRTATFAHGALLIDATPAMIVIDVDGAGDPTALALSAAGAVGSAIRRFDMGGNIGIDFPTIADKAGRRRVDAALADALGDHRHERTAMNGFGFIQIVSRLQRPSLIHRAAYDRTGVLVRRLLRQAEAIAEPGAILLTVPPAIEAALRHEWRDELARRSGRPIRIETDPALALEGAFAQAVPI